MIRMALASKLKYFRKRAGLNVNDAGALIGKSGKTISAWECGRGQPDADMLLKLCEIYKVDSVSDFFDQPAVPELSPSELSLLSAFRAFNVEGQGKVLSYVADLERAGIYKK